MRASAGAWTAAAFGAACMLWFPTTVVGQTAKAGVVTTLQGTATVARATAANPAPLKFKDDVFVRDHIVTGDSSIVRILLGGKAVVTIRERSALTIHETPTTSTVEIDSGKIAVAVAKDRMRPGDSVQVKTPNAMAGIRGTVLIADVSSAPASGTVTTQFTLLTGIVDVSQVDAGTGQPTGQALTLHPLQAVTVVGHTPPGAIRTLSRAEATAIATQYKVSLPAPPPPANVQVTEQQIDLAAHDLAALTGSGNGTAVGARVESPTSTAKGGSASGVTVTTSTSTPGVSVGGGATVGGGGIAAGGTVSVGSGVSAGGSIGVGGGISAGGTVGAGGIGAGVSVGVGGGGISAGGTVGVGGTTVGGSVTIGGGGTIGSGGITGTGSGSGTVGGIVPRLTRPLL